MQEMKGFFPQGVLGLWEATRAGTRVSGRHGSGEQGESDRRVSERSSSFTDVAEPKQP